MTELRFHDELYDGFAVDEAAKAYAAYGAMELSREAACYVVKVALSADAAGQGIDEATLALEVGNYALGKTIERRGGASGMGGSAPQTPENVVLDEPVVAS